MRPLLFLTLFLCGMEKASAQAAPNWLEDALYGGGKLNVVVAVVAIIILGIGAWLWSQDRRLTRMEKELKKPLP